MAKAIASALEELGEKQTSAPRLLRKPLVLKGTTKRVPEAQSQASAASPNAPSAPSEPGHVAATNRIMRKFQENNQASASKQGTASVHRALSATSSSSAPPAASPSPAIPKAAPLAPMKSAVFEEDPHRQLGTGKIPWIVLGAALATLLAWLVISRL